MEENDFIDQDIQAQKSVFRSMMVEHWKKQYYSGTYSDRMPDSYRDIIDTIVDKRTKPPYLFITINAKSEITNTNFIKAIFKMLSKKWLTSYIGAFEFYGTELDKHTHFHMLVNRKSKIPSEVIRELKRSVYQICDTENPHIFNVKYLQNEEAVLQQKVNYILGIKKEEKNESVELNSISRKKYGLKPYYLGPDSERFLSLVETRTNKPKGLELPASDSEEEESDAETSEEEDNPKEYDYPEIKTDGGPSGSDESTPYRSTG